MSTIGKPERVTQDRVIALFRDELDYDYLGDWTHRDGKIEAWGRGIERIMTACKEAGVPVPILRYEATGLWTVFPFSDEQINLGKRVGDTTQETTQEKILALVQAEPSITRKKLAKRIGLSADGIKYHMEKMKAAGVIRHVGPTKSGHWEILK